MPAGTTRKPPRSPQGHQGPRHDRGDYRRGLKARDAAAQRAYRQGLDEGKNAKGRRGLRAAARGEGIGPDVETPDDTSDLAYRSGLEEGSRANPRYHARRRQAAATARRATRSPRAPRTPTRPLGGRRSAAMPLGGGGGGVAHSAAGVFLGAIFYALVLSVVDYGTKGPGMWFKAKFLNEVSTPSSSSSTTPSTTTTTPAPAPGSSVPLPYAGAPSFPVVPGPTEGA